MGERIIKWLVGGITSFLPRLTTGQLFRRKYMKFTFGGETGAPIPLPPFPSSSDLNLICSHEQICSNEYRLNQETLSYDSPI